MIGKPLETHEAQELFDQCLDRAIREGLPCLIGAGLSSDAMDAINDCGREFPDIKPATLERAKSLRPQ